MKKLSVNLVCALHCEAKPLIKYYNLKRKAHRYGFSVFARDSIRLVVTGLGRVSIAAGTFFLGHLNGEHGVSVWLNVGLAGHRFRSLGEGLIAHKILDGSTGKSWYPPLVFEPKVPTEVLMTVEVPETVYEGSTLYDMEASGFYPTALRFSSAELIHCFKVVSDNSLNLPIQLNPEKAEELIRSRLYEVDGIIKGLQDLAGKKTVFELDRGCLHDLFSRWHFSDTQKKQLERLWRRVQVLKLDGKVLVGELNALESGKEVLRFIETRVQESPIRIGKEP